MKKAIFIVIVILLLLIPSICGFISPGGVGDEEIRQSKTGNIIFLVIIAVAVIALLSIPLYNKIKESFK